MIDTKIDEVVYENGIAVGIKSGDKVNWINKQVNK